MEILQTTGRKRQTYKIQLEQSLLWEAALGIAAITNSRLINTLELKESYWSNIREIATEELIKELHYVENHNTWKAILQILHQDRFEKLEEFEEFVEQTGEVNLRFICIPFLGEDMQDIRWKAAKGNLEAVNFLMDYTDDNPFFPEYISFISRVDRAVLKNHLKVVMKLWFKEVLDTQRGQVSQILELDYTTKNEYLKKMESEEFVQWATGGISYLPEPSIHTVLLIPQFCYRPWNIVGDIEGAKVFYYPVSSQSVHPEDRYLPDQITVLKYKALGDEVRLKIVKLLYEEDRTLQELKDRLDIGKSTIHHHLKILRSAKLVVVRESKYSLQEELIRGMAREVEAYLGR
ncbi:transcriptional regulator [Tetzosporium hominis]|uniref:Transcriptional regulator n=1 Tax=Tetzosporium hominis TaxID=2020506 RepID=A0A264W020_9BACL|nr:winged helix-turn-helix domain-containing protein [Tetzosporium hominis]OZS76922.1 transcriptional regulator [Tetzosporium hominis]